MAFWNRIFGTPNPPKFSGPVHESAEAFIRSFCQDYNIWNDYCLAASDKRKRTNYSKMPSELSEAYAEFVYKYTAPEVSLQPISFGTDATFDPNRLTCNPAKIANARLTQVFSIRSTLGNWSNDYIAHIIEREDGSLQLEQIFYIDPFPETANGSGTEYLPCL